MEGGDRTAGCVDGDATTLFPTTCRGVNPGAGSTTKDRCLVAGAIDIALVDDTGRLDGIAGVT
jgi:hypothetical protein